MTYKKSGALTFIFACIPGCGEMYLGYMKRGLSICALFWGVIALGMFTQLDALMCVLPVIWLYGFFDAFNIRGYDDEQSEANPDSYLFGIDDKDSKFRLSGKSGLIVGWILVIIGVYALWNMFADFFFHYFSSDIYWLYDIIANKIPGAVILVLVICLGVWFIRGPKHKDDDDFKSFTPPAEAFDAQKPYTSGASVNGEAHAEGDAAADDAGVDNAGADKKGN